MKNLGYKLNEVQPVDMFTGAHHVEVLTLLERTN